MYFYFHSHIFSDVQTVFDTPWCRHSTVSGVQTVPRLEWPVAGGTGTDFAERRVSARAASTPGLGGRDRNSSPRNQPTSLPYL